jgi:hypothetical protein
MELAGGTILRGQCAIPPDVLGDQHTINDPEIPDSPARTAPAWPAGGREIAPQFLRRVRGTMTRHKVPPFGPLPPMRVG